MLGWEKIQSLTAMIAKETFKLKPPHVAARKSFFRIFWETLLGWMPTDITNSPVFVFVFVEIILQTFLGWLLTDTHSPLLLTLLKLSQTQLNSQKEKTQTISRIFTFWMNGGMVKKQVSCYGVMKANHKRLIKAAESQYGPFENTLEGCFYSWKMVNNTPQIT